MIVVSDGNENDDENDDDGGERWWWKWWWTMMIMMVRLFKVNDAWETKSDSLKMMVPLYLPCPVEEKAAFLPLMQRGDIRRKCNNGGSNRSGDIEHIASGGEELC